MFLVKIYLILVCLIIIVKFKIIISIKFQSIMEEIEKYCKFKGIFECRNQLLDIYNYMFVIIKYIIICFEFEIKWDIYECCCG